jgi:hypothetical protein
MALVLASAALASSAVADDPIREELKLLMSYGEGFAHALAGRSTRQTSNKRPNVHRPDQFDKVVTEHFAGIEVSWLHPAPASHVQLLLSLSVSKPSAQLPAGLKIGGSSEADIRSSFGTPEKVTRDRLTYEVPADANANMLIFHLRDGRLSRVYWEWFLE